MDYFHVAFESLLKLNIHSSIFPNCCCYVEMGKNVPINVPEEKENHMSLELILSCYCII